MRYMICDRQKAIAKGFNPDTHRRKEQEVMLNEKEVMISTTLKGDTFEDRIEEIGGRQLTEQEAITEIDKGDWK